MSRIFIKEIHWGFLEIGIILNFFKKLSQKGLTTFSIGGIIKVQRERKRGKKL
jgi:hypothetical protein